MVALHQTSSSMFHVYVWGTRAELTQSVQTTELNILNSKQYILASDDEATNTDPKECSCSKSLSGCSPIMNTK